LSDEDLLRRPHPQCNHVNWQVGHLIAAEHQMMEQLKPGGMPPLPDQFATRYAKETQRNDDPSQFCTKEQLLRTHAAQRAGTKRMLSLYNAEDLDRETGVDYAPTVGAMIGLQSSHWLMHAGQWVIVRRELGKPLLF
jgi:hypothetical protein